MDSVSFTNFVAGKKVIVVGEMHGTTEVPLFVLQLAKQLMKTKSKITVGLEIPVNYQSDIDEFLMGGDFEKLKRLDHFKYPDGRTSVAMEQLIIGLRELRNVEIVCFDVDSNLSSGVSRDSLMGINLSKTYEDGQMTHNRECSGLRQYGIIYL